MATTHKENYKGYMIGVTDGKIWATWNGESVREPFDDTEFQSLAQCKQWLDEDRKYR